MDAGRRPGKFDENLVRMKKSCERIAAVLGLKNGEMPDVVARRASQRSPVREYVPEPMNFTNMNNPSGVRHIQPREEQQELPSAYKSLREKSPVRKSQAQPSPERNDSADRTATKFASVSQADNFINHFDVCVEHGPAELARFEGAPRPGSQGEGGFRQESTHVRWAKPSVIHR